MKTFWHTSEDLKTLIPIYRGQHLRFIIISIIFILCSAEGRYYFSDNSFIFITLGGIGLICFFNSIYQYNWGWHKWEKTAKMVQTFTPVEENIIIECYVKSKKPHDGYDYFWEFSLENFSNIKNKIKYTLTVPFDFSKFMLRNYQSNIDEYDGKTIPFNYEKAQIYFDPATPKVIVIRLPETGLLIGEINYFQKLKSK